MTNQSYDQKPASTLETFMLLVMPAVVFFLLVGSIYYFRQEQKNEAMVVKTSQN